MRILILVIFWISITPVFSQTGVYMPLGGGITSGLVPSTMVYDSVENKLFVQGGFSSIGGKPIFCFAQWNGYEWDSVPEVPVEELYRIKKVNHKIYAYGRGIWEKSSAGVWTLIAKADTLEGVTDLAWYNNELIIMGGFDTLNGQPFNSFARYDGVSLLPFPASEVWPLYSCQFYASAVYQGNLYVGGMFANSTGSLQYLMKYDGGSNWVQVGTPLNGVGAHYADMMVYKGYLYLGGGFKMADGNPGNHFMRYDGASFDDLNGGLHPSVGFWDMTHHDDKLFISGGKKINGGPDYGGFITFDGVDFCTYDTFSISTGLPYYFPKICFMGDTLVVAGFNQAYNGDTINALGKYLGSFNSVSCINVGIDEQTGSDQKGLLLYPNPNNGRFTLELNEPVEGHLLVTNSFGQTVLQKALKYENRAEIDLLACFRGIYFVMVRTSKAVFSAKVVVE